MLDSRSDFSVTAEGSFLQPLESERRAEQLGLSKWSLDFRVNRIMPFNMGIIGSLA